MTGAIIKTRCSTASFVIISWFTLTSWHITLTVIHLLNYELPEGSHPLNVWTFQFSNLIFSPSVQYKKWRPCWNSSVGIYSCYRIGGPGIELRWGRVFLHPSRRVLMPTQPPIPWVLGHSLEKSDRGLTLTIHLHLTLRQRRCRAIPGLPLRVFMEG